MDETREISEKKTVGSRSKQNMQQYLPTSFQVILSVQQDVGVAVFLEIMNRVNCVENMNAAILKAKLEFISLISKSKVINTKAQT